MGRVQKSSILNHNRSHSTPIFLKPGLLWRQNPSRERAGNWPAANLAKQNQQPSSAGDVQATAGHPVAHLLSTLSLEAMRDGVRQELVHRQWAEQRQQQDAGTGAPITSGRGHAPRRPGSAEVSCGRARRTDAVPDRLINEPAAREASTRLGGLFEACPPKDAFRLGACYAPWPVLR